VHGTPRMTGPVLCLKGVPGQGQGRGAALPERVSEAYEAITRAHWAPVVAAVTRRFGDLHIAEDAATEAFTTPQTTSEPNARWWLVTHFLSTPLALSSA
jgi:hypothetical protein